jgi:hypothetical protein
MEIRLGKSLSLSTPENWEQETWVFRPPEQVFPLQPWPPPRVKSLLSHQDHLA